jgi:hypothetical protein
MGAVVRWIEKVKWVQRAKIALWKAVGGGVSSGLERTSQAPLWCFVYTYIFPEWFSPKAAIMNDRCSLALAQRASERASRLARS